MSATAKTTLPKLLAGLPKYGQGQLVQPVSWKTMYPNSFYKITRTKLRFQQVDEAGKPIVASAVADKGKAKEQPREEDEFEEDNDDGDIFGELAEEEIVAQQTGGRPHGKAWGVLFWNGESLSRLRFRYIVRLTPPYSLPLTRPTQDPHKKCSQIPHSRRIHLHHPRNRHSRATQGVMDTTRYLCFERRNQAGGGRASDGTQGQAADGIRSDVEGGEEGGQKGSKGDEAGEAQEHDGGAPGRGGIIRRVGPQPVLRPWTRRAAEPVVKRFMTSS
jgi:hypothetical protein